MINLKDKAKNISQNSIEQTFNLCNKYSYSLLRESMHDSSNRPHKFNDMIYNMHENEQIP